MKTTTLMLWLIVVAMIVAIAYEAFATTVVVNLQEPTHRERPDGTQGDPLTNLARCQFTLFRVVDDAQVELAPPVDLLASSPSGGGSHSTTFTDMPDPTPEAPLHLRVGAWCEDSMTPPRRSRIVSFNLIREYVAPDPGRPRPPTTTITVEIVP